MKSKNVKSFGKPSISPQQLVKFTFLYKNSSMYICSCYRNRETSMPSIFEESVSNRAKTITSESLHFTKMCTMQHLQ